MENSLDFSLSKKGDDVFSICVITSDRLIVRLRSIEIDGIREHDKLFAMENERTFEIARVIERVDSDNSNPGHIKSVFKRFERQFKSKPIEAKIMEARIMGENIPHLILDVKSKCIAEMEAWLQFNSRCKVDREAGKVSLNDNDYRDPSVCRITFSLVPPCADKENVIRDANVKIKKLFGKRKVDSGFECVILYNHSSNEIVSAFFPKKDKVIN